MKISKSGMQIAFPRFMLCPVCFRNVVIVHEQCISVPQIMEMNDKLCYTPPVGTDITNNN